MPTRRFLLRTASIRTIIDHSMRTSTAKCLIDFLCIGLYTAGASQSDARFRIAAAPSMLQPLGKESSRIRRSSAQFHHAFETSVKLFILLDGEGLEPSSAYTHWTCRKLFHQL